MLAKFLTSKNPVSLYHEHSTSSSVSPTTDATVSSVLRDSVPSLTSPTASFNSHFLKRGGMRQTLLASVGIGAAKPRPINYQRSNIVLPDGGNLRVDLAPSGAFDNKDDDRPVVILVHGILGDSNAPYITGPANEFLQNGFRCASVNLRGCGGTRVTSPAYHDAGKTADLKSVLLFVDHLAPLAHKFLLGCSLGAGLVTNCLGEMGEKSPVTAAVGLSNVFSYSQCFKELKTKGTMMNLVINKILGRRYQKLAKDLEMEAFTEEIWLNGLVPLDAQSNSSKFQNKPLPPSTQMATTHLPYTPSIATTMSTSDVSTALPASTPPSSIRSTVDSRVHSFLGSLKSRNHTMTSFSRNFIAPLSGASTVAEFCESTSSAQRIENIRIPMLFINAKDDPMLPGKYLPVEEVLKNPHVALAVTDRGGHLGWISKEKGDDGRNTQWFNRPIVEFFLGILKAQPANRPRMETAKGPALGMTYSKESRNVGFMMASNDFIRYVPLAAKTPRK